MRAARPDYRAPINLLGRFALASFGVIAAIAIANGVLLSGYVQELMLKREAEVSRDFVLNILNADSSTGYLRDQSDLAVARRFAGSIEHFTTMPEVTRINVYSTSRTLLWSTNRALVGKQFDTNRELEEALLGNLAVEGGRISDEQRSKPEHIGLSAGSEFFVETYIPLRETGKPEVLGVLELYKAPAALTAAIRAAQRRVWISAAAGGLLLFLTLFWLVRSADRRLAAQRNRLIENETLSVVGELASAVAHNIRNPLASIRSSAELLQVQEGGATAEIACDIVTGVDRIEGWIRELLSFSRLDAAQPSRIDAGAALRACFASHSRHFQQGEIAATPPPEGPPAFVTGDSALLGHLLHSIVANAIDATPKGGRVAGRIVSAAGRVEIRISDTGRGIAPGDLKRIFGMFYTTKAQGMGIGLTLAHRITERMGGHIDVHSEPGKGTEFVISMKAA